MTKLEKKRKDWSNQLIANEGLKAKRTSVVQRNLYTDVRNDASRLWSQRNFYNFILDVIKDFLHTTGELRK